jgi:hypothetical protein
MSLEAQSCLDTGPLDHACEFLATADDLGSLQNAANPWIPALLSDVGLQKSSMNSVTGVRLRI